MAITQPTRKVAQIPDLNAKKKKIDIPYNRPEQRIKRAIRSFIKITIIVSIISAIVAFASIDDVSLNLVLTAISTSIGIVVQILAVLMGIILQFGLLFWFLGRPKVEIIKPGDNTSVTFDDYWGQPQLVKLVKQWMYLLRDRKEYEKMGGKYISGLLLYGPPGTGKTMLAKAVAGESGMAFISAQGTSFQGMFWGMDILMVLRFASWSRQLAKKYGACVAYIDEIDAIGMNRGGVRSGQPGMTSATGMGMGLGMMALSTLLSQMDGINMPSRWERFKMRFYNNIGRNYKPKPNNWHVMWMGSTNRPDVLDPALTRSGRLDTKIAVEAPDRVSRRLIVQGYLDKIKCDDSIDIEAIVNDTNGLTPADIASAITKDAVRIAFFDGRRLVSQRDIDRAFMEQQDGMEMPLEEFAEDQRQVLAYHEAGHAIAMYYMAPEQKILRATINPLSTGVKGYVQRIDSVEQHVTPVIRIAYNIIISLAGRAAEKIFSGEMYQSVGGDYPAVNFWLSRLVSNGFFGPPIDDYDSTHSIVDKDQNQRKKFRSELTRYWLAMEDATEKLMRNHWREVTAVAEELLLKRTLTGRELQEIIEKNQTPDSLDDNIIPKTMASLRAQALAEIRNGSMNGHLNGNGYHVNGHHNGHGNGRVIEAPRNNEQSTQPAQKPKEDVVVINGNNNGGAQKAPEVVEENGGRYTPQQVEN
ncbi:MAG: AAA family ATPase [Anaerolineae bacterium]|nr:AAA family ATPase [Anaerolineae bacterium]